jgi:hypothetical protein
MTASSHLPWTCATLIAAVLALAGCPELDDPYLPYPEPDFQLYVGEIQPIVDQSCSSLGCHGVHDRRLTLYSVDFLRAEPRSVGEPLEMDRLSAGELAWNYDGLRLRMLDEPDAEDSRLVLKCLDPELGGIPHGDGVIVWEDREDRDYLDFVDWLETGL